ncbi:MAG: VWA domain-containing protein [Acidobacteria bacterium]|nr:MAG: VWA domain-containing protein [Acidobacteriota bacterium]
MVLGVVSTEILEAVDEPVTAGPMDLQIELLDGEGRPLATMAGELEVRSGEDLVGVSDRGSVGANWRVVLYFDQLLSDSIVFRNATIELAGKAVELTRLGPVEVVLGGAEVKTALPPTRDPDALRQALGWLRLREDAQDLQAGIRRELLALIEPEEEEQEGSAGTVDLSHAVAEAHAQERQVLRGQRERLLTWAVENRAPGPKALFYIGSGFDAEPADFYRSQIDPSLIGPVAGALQSGPITPSVEELGQVLSVFGWTTFPSMPPVREDLLLTPGDDSPQVQEGADKVDVIYQDGRLVDKTTIGFDPTKVLRERRKARDEEETGPVLLNPVVPLQVLAQITGGEVLGTDLQLTDLLERLPQRRQVTLDSDGSKTGMERIDISVLADAGEGESPAVVRSREWVSAVTPEVVATVRSRQLLNDEIDEGDLPVSAALQPAEPGAENQVVIQFEASAEVLERSETVPLRVSLASEDSEGRVEIDHQLLVAEPASGLAFPDEERSFEDRALELSVPLKKAPDGPVMVLVEELSTGLWGGVFASVFESAEAGAMAVDDVASLVLPAPKVIHLMAPRHILAMGQTTLETVVSESEVARVDFYLDGEREAVRRSRPFSAVLDLGPLPQPRRVEVVAYGSSGEELGRDFLIVNEGSGVFGVRIVEPVPHTESGKPRKLVGPVDVEAAVEPRRGEGIDRVEFYWKDSLVATRYARPFRQRVVIPEDSPTGFIRVVAYLEDGASSEDVVFLNSPGSSERLQVNLMELYVVVTDRRGHPVRGMTKDQFRVAEAGKPQEIATFSDAGDLPLTVGLAIDSSASMFVKLPDVQFAAAEFIRKLTTRRDRVFIVGFGGQPKMARTTTSDLPEVVESLNKLQPNGKTAIWQAIVYSLVQLQGVPGKKALIVYSDGADEDPDFSYRTALRFARRVGVPIYIIVSNNEIVRTEGKGLSVRGFLDRLENLAESVGGRVFMARVGDDMEDVYREIEEELRSQYLVGYYSRDMGGKEWRRVEVAVAKPGLKARTIAGYFR